MYRAYCLIRNQGVTLKGVRNIGNSSGSSPLNYSRSTLRVETLKLDSRTSWYCGVPPDPEDYDPEDHTDWAHYTPVDYGHEIRAWAVVAELRGPDCS